MRELAASSSRTLALPTRAVGDKLGLAAVQVIGAKGPDGGLATRRRCRSMNEGDGLRPVLQLRPMELNDIVVFAGRRFIVVGFDPMSVSPQRAYLRDVKTGEEVPLLYDELMKRLRDTGGHARPLQAEELPDE
jgi:hypothetical protein